jgi:hypothetical protein
MIAGVNGSAVLAALLILVPFTGRAADDAAGAARELARKTVVFAGKGEPVSVSWRNLSSLPPADFNQTRDAFEAAVREAGGRISDIAPLLEARITLSPTPTQYLLVEEAKKGDERQTWIASWKRPEHAQAVPGLAVTLEKKLLWEQEEPILDLAILTSGVLVLSPAGVSVHAEGVNQTAPVSASKPWPRDLRGRLRVNAESFKTFLPGTVCTGQLTPSLTIDCHPSDEPWPLDVGSRGTLLANYAPARNFFDGKLTLPSGGHKTVSPFYSVAPIQEGNRSYWLLALVDGRTQILDNIFEPAGSVNGWGSDIAATEARCAGGSQILATKAGDAHDPDAIRAYRLANRAPVALSAPLDFSGPVTALWSLGGTNALVVVNDLASGHYQAYLLMVSCGG